MQNIRIRTAELNLAPLREENKNTRKNPLCSGDGDEIQPEKPLLKKWSTWLISTIIGPNFRSFHASLLFSRRVL